MSEQNPYAGKPYGDNPYESLPEYGGPSPYGETAGYGDQAGYGYPQHPPTMMSGSSDWQHSAPTMMGGDGGWQHHAPVGYGGQGAATLLTIGDIAVTGDSIITPAGALPLRGAVWTVSDMSRTEESTPAYAIVLAVIFFFACLLGLLFMLIKERKTTGFIQVTVHSGGRYHATMIPARGPNDGFAINQQVNHARSLCA